MIALRASIRRPLPLLAGLSLFAAGLAGCAATRPHAAMPTSVVASYFPTRPGTVWGYDVTLAGSAADGPIFATRRVAARSGGQVRIQFGTDTQVYEVMPDGVQDAGGYVLRVPAQQGASWPTAGGTATVLSTSAAVNVPAGHYSDCLVIEERGAASRTITTYAPEVGPVEIRVEDASSLLVADAVLRGFSPAAVE